MMNDTVAERDITIAACDEMQEKLRRARLAQEMKSKLLTVKPEVLAKSTPHVNFLKAYMEADPPYK